MDKSIINEITIVNLADDTKHIEEVARWHFEEWSDYNRTRYEDDLHMTKHSLCKDRIPFTFIAKYKDEAVGMVSIWNSDMKSRQDLTPWLAALYIKKEYRGIGIGTLLQKKCIETVKSLGYKSLYLTSDLENYYERTGWKFLDRAPVNQHLTKIYEYKIAD